MAMMRRCQNCNRPYPVYRLAGVLLDGRVAQVCPRCVSTEKDRIETPYYPHHDGRSIQPSTGREVW
jgi:hypothetical protein